MPAVVEDTGKSIIVYEYIRGVIEKKIETEKLCTLNLIFDEICKKSCILFSLNFSCYKRTLPFLWSIVLFLLLGIFHAWFHSKLFENTLFLASVFNPYACISYIVLIVFMKFLAYIVQNSVALVDLLELITSKNINYLAYSAFSKIYVLIELR